MDTLLATHVPPAEIAVRLGLAVVFGLFLGLDRELRGKPAGLRTHMLVGLGAAVTTLSAFELYYGILEPDETTLGDPLRAIEGVIGAIGFLGAGAIIASQRDVKYLTTAANIWLAGAIGMACGGGLYLVAAIGFALTLIILTLVSWIERRFLPRRGREEVE
jgi:putative Mg2+ transporter-C (MgtC) family protein